MTEAQVTSIDDRYFLPFTITLADRVYTCPTCGDAEDRDVNAARDILCEGLRSSTVGRTGIDACGQLASTIASRKRFGNRKPAGRSRKNVQTSKVSGQGAQ